MPSILSVTRRGTKVHFLLMPVLKTPPCSRLQKGSPGWGRKCVQHLPPSFPPLLSSLRFSGGTRGYCKLPFDSSPLIMQIDFIICSDSKVLWNVFISRRVELGECSLRGTRVCTILHAPVFERCKCTIFSTGCVWMCTRTTLYNLYFLVQS